MKINIFKINDNRNSMRIYFSVQKSLEKWLGFE